MIIDNEIKKLIEEYHLLFSSRLITWEAVKNLNKIIGVYLVYEKDKIIYVGHSKNLSIRFGTDMINRTTHTLHKKLLYKYETPEQVRYFLKNKCRYRIFPCEDILKAECMEHLVIWQKKPCYNKGIWLKKNET